MAKRGGRRKEEQNEKMEEVKEGEKGVLVGRGEKEKKERVKEGKKGVLVGRGEKEKKEEVKEGRKRW